MEKGGPGSRQPHPVTWASRQRALRPETRPQRCPKPDMYVSIWDDCRTLCKVDRPQGPLLMSWVLDLLHNPKESITFALHRSVMRRGPYRQMICNHDASRTAPCQTPARGKRVSCSVLWAVSNTWCFKSLWRMHHARDSFRGVDGSTTLSARDPSCFSVRDTGLAGKFETCAASAFGTLLSPRNASLSLPSRLVHRLPWRWGVVDIVLNAHAAAN